LTENKGEALELLRKALVAPRFDKEALDRVRAQVLSGIASDEKDPSTIASAVFDAKAFGDHPYGSARDGTIESVTALTQADISAAHRNALTRDRLYVSVAGVASPDDAGFALAGGVTVVDFETPQSVAFFGHKGLKRDDDDFFAAFILNHILGAGGFESRLMQEVREERGLTYGISTFLVPMFHAEMMLGQVASSNETIAEAIEVTRYEWALMATEGVSANELTDAKTFLTGAYPLRFDGNAEIAKIMVGMQMVGLSPDYVVDRNDFVEAVTLEEINRVASELMQPDDLHFVVVGQPVGLTSTN
jgi:zinc protease